MPVTTLTLRPGMVVNLPATLNSPAYRGTVDFVEPWVLTAGPRAGQQARAGRGKNSPLLWTVRVTGLVVTGPALRAMSPADAEFAAADAQRLAVPADRVFEVVQ